MNLTDLQIATLEIVCTRSKGNEITGREIAKLIGLKERRSGKDGADMRSIINALRVKGYPICANGSGYHWAASQAELDRFVESFRLRIWDQEKALNGMRQNVHYQPMDTIEI